MTIIITVKDTDNIIGVKEQIASRLEDIVDIERVEVGMTYNELSKADVVEAVRCKDCRYWQDNNGGYPHEECRWGKDETPDADDFCSYGERKDT